MPHYRVKCGKMEDLLPKLPDNYFHSVVCDPPYELGFMGKSWDSSGVAFNPETWKHVLRVLKPGGHLLAFGGTRTAHRITVAIEDAGFEIRDVMMYLYGSGFPKSLDVSKAIDKAAGAEREIVGCNGTTPRMKAGRGVSGLRVPGSPAGDYDGDRVITDITAPSTESAKQWEGWGTALKPAYEPIIIARKPLSGTVVKNVLKHGTGAMNIGACRVGTESVPINRLEEWSGFGQKERPAYTATVSTGRWPANIMHDGSDEVLEAFAVAGDKSSARKNGNPNQPKRGGNTEPLWGMSDGRTTHDFRDEGTAARFFYTAKASKRERNEGLDHMPDIKHGYSNAAKAAVKRGDDPNIKPVGINSIHVVKNDHPTVKPQALMRYLVKLVTPPGGICADFFMGSGSTGVAALREGFHFWGCDVEQHSVDIAKARIEHVQAKIKAGK